MSLWTCHRCVPFWGLLTCQRVCSYDNSVVLNLLRKKYRGFGQTHARRLLIILKAALTSAPVLALPKAGIPFEVICDAAGFGLGQFFSKMAGQLFLKAGSCWQLNKITQPLSRSSWL